MSDEERGGERGPGGECAREALGKRLRELRQGSGRTYASLARRIGVSASTLHRYCTGQTVPAEFAPVERLARLCGRTPEERESLHRLWLRADAERVERMEAGAGAASGVGVGTGADAPLAGGSRPPGGSVPPAGPGRPPASVPPAPTPVHRDGNPPAHAGAPPSARRWVRALSVCGAVAVLALALTGSLPERSEGRAAVSAPPAPPFTWTSDDHVWKYGCGHSYLVARPPITVPPPPAEADAEGWAAALGAVHAGETEVRITLQGRDERAVVLEALRIRVVERRAPADGRVHRMSSGCGGALTPRTFDVDLDRERPVARSVPGNDTGEPIPAVSFPYRVSASDPEVLLITARAARCDCDWVAELRWSGGGRSGTVRIDDGGRPFRTSGAPGRPVHDYDHEAGRWVVGP
ncbi:helix-turn-helix protein [Streptomyces cavourensis]|uniref:helix-turn-helix domain-containing protein n=1 Tax=Streptomyces cavourensis TaxID=67258 RepID=UPI00114F6D30|nr:helix-turn-helix transcriptional regulator [Streptomyces cavourensis]TQO34520.1 helix-turn-helix protein [Streptomyces cavourensis]